MTQTLSTSPITEATKQVATLRENIQNLDRQYADDRKKWARRLYIAEQNLAIASKGLDYARIRRAREHIDTNSVRPGARGEPYWDYNQQVVDDAMADLATGPTKLLTREMGVKNYDRFHHQREDHEYGYGPKHGSIVFRVGLTLEGRRIFEAAQASPDAAEEQELAAQVREDALYLLSNLKTVLEQEATVAIPASMRP